MGAKGGRWRRSEVQALLLPKARFTRAQALAWARTHGYKAAAVEPNGIGEYWRVRQFDPAGRECRTVAFGRGVKAVVCSPRRNPLLAISNAEGEAMADRVYEIAYRHKADGLDYVHVFKDPDNVELVVLAPRAVLLRGKRRRILEEH